MSAWVPHGCEDEKDVEKRFGDSLGNGEGEVVQGVGGAIAVEGAVEEELEARADDE